MKKELHITRLNMLWRCGEQYYRRYVKGEIVPPRIALIVGSGTHKSVEEDLKEKVEKKRLLPKDVVKDIAAEYVDKNLHKDAVMLNEDEKSKGFEKVKGEAKDTAVSLSELHWQELAPTIEPVAIEKPFTLEIEGENEYSIAGKIDIVEKNRIRDTKTAGKKPAESIITNNNQLKLYALSEILNEKRKVKEIALDYLIKTKKPYQTTLSASIDNQDFEILLARITNALRQLKAGIFPPTNPENWWCSPQFCGYYHTCPYVKKTNRKK